MGFSSTYNATASMAGNGYQFKRLIPAQNEARRTASHERQVGFGETPSRMIRTHT